MFGVDGRSRSDIFARNTAFYAAEGALRRVKDTLVGQRITLPPHPSTIAAVAQVMSSTLFGLDGNRLCGREAAFSQEALPFPPSTDAEGVHHQQAHVEDAFVDQLVNHLSHPYTIAAVKQAAY